MKSIVVVDESPSIRETLAIVLGREHHVVTAATIDTMPADEAPALVILGLPPAARESAMLDAAVAALDARVPLLLLSRPGKTAEARLRRSGRRVSCVPKPFELHVLRAAVNAAVAEEPDKGRPAAPGGLLHRLEYPYVSHEGAAMAARIVATDLPVLVIGETGTGALEIAQGLHTARARHGRLVVRAASALDARELHRARRRAAGGTLMIGDVETATHETQHAMLALLRENDAGARMQPVDLVATARAPLDERVAAGAFLAELAFALESLTLRLPPLRERSDDIPALVAAETRRLAARLGLGPVTYTSAALQRLGEYLWFGNVAELEAVIARTLALHRRTSLDAADLLFVAGDAPPMTESPAQHAHAASPDPGREGQPPPRAGVAARHERSETAPVSPPSSEYRDRLTVGAADSGTAAERRPRALHALPPSGSGQRALAAEDAARDSDLPGLEVLVGELAHELRNPMVTIKTFAQHLDSVLADPEARVRFAALTGDAITRMDALLETLLDFARFRAPQRQSTDLRALMERALAERRDELGRKDVRIERNGAAPMCVDADEAQLLFAFRSLLTGLLPDLLPHEPLAVSAPGPATLAITARTERPISQRLAQLVGDGDAPAGGDALPLAFALAATLIRRNGGTLRSGITDDGRTAIRIEWAPE